MTKATKVRLQEPEKNRVFNFLTGNEPVHEFESWVYNSTDLEKRVGSDLYLELAGANYKDKFIIDVLKEAIVGKYLSDEELDNFIYEKVLLNAGWRPGRKIQVNFLKTKNSPELQNAYNIIEEFGGLKFIAAERKENRSLTLVEFLLEPIAYDFRQYGVNKSGIRFATAHNSHIDLFVDEDNRYYQLDNVVSEHLYVFNGRDFKHMMHQLLQLDKEDNFVKVSDAST